MTDTEAMRIQMEQFVHGQEGYDPAREEEITVEWKDSWYLEYTYRRKYTLWGNAGTLDEAFINFVLNWKQTGGFSGLGKNIEELDNLKEGVLSFVEAQEGFKGMHENVSAFAGDIEWVVIYGEDFQRGIGAVGLDAPDAYEAFVRTWYRLKGFDWIQKNRTGVHP